MKNKKYFAHETVVIDDNVSIGKNSKIWHFSHIQSNAVIGENCSLGQNVNISNNVKIGNNVKIQNNVSIYEGVELEDHVFCGPSAVFTNVLKPRAEFPKKDPSEYVNNCKKICYNWGKCNNFIRYKNWKILFCWCRRRCLK